MHIWDGPISPAVCAAAGAVSLGCVAYSLRRVEQGLGTRTVPLTAMVAALVFAGQMVNFPTGVGAVSGHLMGGVLAAALVGPWAGCIAMTLVLLVQWAMFADGGMLSLGVNVLHMAVLGSLGGYALYSFVRNRFADSLRGSVIASVVASWVVVTAAAALFCLEFALSTPGKDLGTLFALMMSVHSVIGVGEALMTGGIIGFVARRAPELLYVPERASSTATGVGRVAVVGLLCAMVMAGFLSPFASEFPDGLEYVGRKMGFDELDSAPALMLDDYAIPGLSKRPGWERISVAVAGIGGTLSVVAIALGMGRLLTRKHAYANEPSSE
jgi:cobalt/nickel transport system permease protein